MAVALWMPEVSKRSRKWLKRSQKGGRLAYPHISQVKIKDFSKGNHIYITLHYPLTQYNLIVWLTQQKRERNSSLEEGQA